ncbi:MAG: signal recognition particle-docking protein FtsY [Anaerolineae bacterium]
MFGRKSSIGEALAKTRRMLRGRIQTIFGAGDITEETWETLEETLIQADVGAGAAIELVERLRKRVADGEVTSAQGVEALLKEEMLAVLRQDAPHADEEPRLLTVVLVVGVNGSGKTTSVAKLARYYTQKGHKVMLAAADTFRAAAIDQLRIWAERAGVAIVAHQPNSDPGAVVYDAIRASRARGADLLIVDTAGRLHTKYNLMAELKKVADVARRNVHRAPHEVFLVLDATTGQNAIQQARHFRDAVGLTGVVLAKLDGTAKGGVVFSIAEELQVPVRFVGTGETIEDLAVFDAEAFVNGLFENGNE